jgi:tripartite ATP-independent transporter DctP family solute receptor
LSHGKITKGTLKEKTMSTIGRLTAISALAIAMALPASAETLRLSTQANAPHPWLDAAEVLREDMLKATDGRVDIQIFSGGALGKDATALDEMRMGTIDLLIGGTQEATPFFPEYQLFSLSYLFANEEVLRKAVAPESAISDYFQKVYEKGGTGLKLLALTGGGVRNLSNNTRAVTSIKDIAGMRMRVPGSRMDALMWETSGALPTSLPFTELYTGMQTGVVDAFESTISAYVANKLYEVAPYHARTEHQFMVSHITMSEAAFNRLSEDDQAALMRAAAHASQVAIDAGIKYDQSLLEPYVAAGQITVTEVDKAPFIEIVRPLHDEVAADLGVTDLLELIRNID